MVFRGKACLIQGRNITLILVMAGILSGCGASVAASTDEPAEADPIPALSVHTEATVPTTPAWRIAEHAQWLSDQSCPEDIEFLAPDLLTLDALDIMDPEELADFGQSDGVRLDGAALTAAYELTSSNKHLGGLSGLVVLQHGMLLSLTDVGRIVWLKLDDQTASRPISGMIAELKGASGKPLAGKLEGDSEGLAIHEGLALVSFEGHHRVSAFDLEGCGGAAREVIVAELSSAQEGVPDLGRNGGPEALALSPDGGLVIGVETLDDGRAPLSLAAMSGLYDFSGRLPHMGGMSLTGADIVEETDGTASLYAVHRSFAVLTGINIAVTKTTLMQNEAGAWSIGESRRLVRMASPAPADNFEGIAVEETADGRRMFLIADDNFSGRQRSLLFVFSLDE